MQSQPNSPNFAIYQTTSNKLLNAVSHTSARIKCHPTSLVTKQKLGKHPRRSNTSSAKLLKPILVLMKPAYFNVLPVTISMAPYFVGSPLSDNTERATMGPTEINDASRNMCNGEKYAAVSAQSCNMPALTVPKLAAESCSSNHFSNQPSTSRRNAEYGSKSPPQNSDTFPKRELLTESYVDNRVFSTLHEGIDDNSLEAGPSDLVPFSN